MTVVEYDFELDYAFDPDGKRYPRLSFEIANVEEPSVALDAKAPYSPSSPNPHNPVDPYRSPVSLKIVTTTG